MRLSRRSLLSSVVAGAVVSGIAAAPSAWGQILFTAQGLPFYFLNNADPTGIADSTTAFQNAHTDAAAQSAGCNIVIPAGTFKLTSTITVNVSNVCWTGQGRGVTTIKNSGTNIDTFNCVPTTPLTGGNIAGIVFRSMSFSYPGADPTAGAHIHLDRCTESIVSDCEFVGHYRDIQLSGCSESCRIVNTDHDGGANCTSLHTGSCAIYVGRRQVNSGVTNAAQDPVDNLWYLKSYSVYISNANIRKLGNGADHGILVGAVDGLFVSNGHIGFASTSCIAFLPEQQNLTITGVNCSNVYWDPNPTAATVYGVALLPNAGFPTAAAFGEFVFSGGFTGGGNNALFINVPTIVSFEMEGHTWSGANNESIKILQGSNIRLSGHSDHCNVSAGGFPHITLGTGGNTISSIEIDIDYNGGGANCIVSAGTINQLIVKPTQAVNMAGSPYLFGHAGTGMIVGNCTTNGRVYTVNNVDPIAIPSDFDAWQLNNTGTITQFRISSTLGYMWPGRRFALYVRDGATLNQASGGATNIQCPGGVNFAAPAGSFVSFVYNGGFIVMQDHTP